MLSTTKPPIIQMTKQIARGIFISESADRRSKYARVPTIIVANLELGDIQQEVLWLTSIFDSAFN